MVFTNVQWIETAGSARAALIKITGSGLEATCRSTDLTDSDEDVQAEAMINLGRIHSHPEQCLPAIVPFLQSTNTLARYYAFSSIAAFGTNAVRWVPVAEIVGCLANPADRSRAARALLGISPEEAAKAGIK